MFSSQAGERDGDQGLLNGALIKDVNTAFRQFALLPGQLLVGCLFTKESFKILPFDTFDKFHSGASPVFWKYISWGDL